MTSQQQLNNPLQRKGEFGQWPSFWCNLQWEEPVEDIIQVFVTYVKVSANLAVCLTHEFILLQIIGQWRGYQSSSASCSVVVVTS